jgi:hypothetical protein
MVAERRLGVVDLTRSPTLLLDHSMYRYSYCAFLLRTSSHVELKFDFNCGNSIYNELPKLTTDSTVNCGTMVPAKCDNVDLRSSQKKEIASVGSLV